MYQPTASTPHTSQISPSQTDIYFLDCSVSPSEYNIQQNHSLQTTYEWMKNKLRSRKRSIQLKGELLKIAGDFMKGFDNSSMQNAMFSSPFFLKYKQLDNQLYISDQNNHIVRSISNISRKNNDQWNGESKIEVGQPKKMGYSNGDRNTCKLRSPRGFDWDMNDNMYICNWSCICKVDGKSNQVSLVAGHATDKGYNDGNNDEARFNGLAGILCHHYQSSIELYVCDYNNHCIRMIDITNGKTSTFAGKDKEEGDIDGTLQSARFNSPWDIVKDDENDHILYVSDPGSQRIKMIDMKKGMVTKLVSNEDDDDRLILYGPHQMHIIGSFIYVACWGFRDCIVRIDKHSKEAINITFNDEKKVSSSMSGITYHELDQCFYISDRHNIYKLE